MKRALLLLTCALLLTAFPMTAQAQSGDDKVNIELDGPARVATGSTFEVTITVSGGPAPASVFGEYSYTATLDMMDWSGLPKVDPRNGSSQNGVFRMNITAPDTPQMLRLTINAVSEDDVNISRHTRTFEFKVIKPMILHANVKNTGTLDVNDVNVRFYADGELVDTVTVNIPAGQTQNVSVEWLTYSDGLHTIMVKVGGGGNVVQLDNGQGTMVNDVWIGPPEKNRWAAIYIIIAVAMVVFLVFAWSWASRKRREKLR